MRRLSEVFDDTWILSQIEEELQVEEHLETLDSSAEERILELALKKINQDTKKSMDDVKKKKVRIFGRGKLLLIALVAVFIGTITVSAQERGIDAIIAPVVELIESIAIRTGLKECINISSDEEAEKLIVENIRERKKNNECEKISDEHSGVKIFVDQVISDGEDAYVYLVVEIADFIVPEQWSSENVLYFKENYLQVGNGEMQKYNFELFQESDGTIYGIIHISMEEIGSGDVEVSLSLNNLDFIIGGEDREIIHLVEGKWNLSWNLQCEKIAKIYDIHTVIDAHDGTFVVNKAVVSPLSVSVSGTIQCDDPTYSQFSCYIYSMILKDGTIVDCNGSFARMQEGSEKIMLKFIFDKMMDTDDIVGVIVNHDSIYFP